MSPPSNFRCWRGPIVTYKHDVQYTKKNTQGWTADSGCGRGRPHVNKSSRKVYFSTRVFCAYTASKCVTDLLHMFRLLRPGPRLQTSQVAGFTSELGFCSGPAGFDRGCAQSAHMWYLGAHLNCTLSSLLFTPHPTEPSTQVLESKGFSFGVRVYAHSPQNKPICGTLANVLSAPRLRLLKPKTLPKPKT